MLFQPCTAPSLNTQYDSLHQSLYREFTAQVEAWARWPHNNSPVCRFAGLGIPIAIPCHSPCSNSVSHSCSPATPYSFSFSLDFHRKDRKEEFSSHFRCWPLTATHTFYIVLILIRTKLRRICCL